MIKLTNYIVTVFLCLIVTQMNAQDSIPENTKEKIIEQFEAHKVKIEKNEREALKKQVELINERLDKNEITEEEAKQQKQMQAEKSAANILNRVAIIDNRMALYKRGAYVSRKTDSVDRFNVTIANLATLKINGKRKKKPVKYDIKTSNDLLIAFGFNNVITEGQSFNHTPFENLGSGFVELGWNWKTRLGKNSNWARIKYGFAFQWNKLDLKENQYFEQNGNKTTIVKLPSELTKSQFRVTNLVLPIYFEFGPSTKVDKKDRIRFQTWDKFKFGIGGYGGLRLGTQQKLRYKENGDRVRQKIHRNYNTSPFVYGVGAYVGFGDVALYAKYDLNTMFKNQTTDMNNVSLGLRFDID